MKTAKSITAWLSLIVAVSTGAAAWAGTLPVNQAATVLLVTSFISAVLPGVIKQLSNDVENTGQFSAGQDSEVKK